MKKFITILIFFYMITSSVKIYADETRAPMSLSFGVFTRHMRSTDDVNENNRLLAFSYDDWFLAWFNNSYSKESFFFGKRIHTERRCHNKCKNWFLQANLYCGAVHGYGNRIPINLKGVAPFMLPTVGIGYKNYSFELGVTPTTDNSAVVGMFKIEF